MPSGAYKGFLTASERLISLLISNNVGRHGDLRRQRLVAILTGMSIGTAWRRGSRARLRPRSSRLSASPDAHAGRSTSSASEFACRVEQLADLCAKNLRARQSAVRGPDLKSAGTVGNVASDIVIRFRQWPDIHRKIFAACQRPRSLREVEGTSSRLTRQKFRPLPQLFMPGGC
jgi:hypothetical protein